MSDAFEAVLPVALDGERLDRVVSMLCARTRAEAAALVDGGSVRLDEAVATRRAERVRAGALLSVELTGRSQEPALQADPSVGFEVVHADEGVVVIDKPAGLVVHPGAGNRSATLVHGLLARFGDLEEVAAPGDEHRPGIVHRLDRDTSGLLVVARTELARERLVRDLAARRVRREYVALVWGSVEESSGLIDAPIGRSARDPTRMAVSVAGRPARTRYEVQERFSEPAEATLLGCVLETGRTHQIRVHLQGIGHPVVGDPRYTGRSGAAPGPARQFLHAARLGFDHPLTGEAMSFESPLPPDLAGALARFS